MSNQSSREQLSICKTVREQFAFLENHFGFQCVVENESRVRYESETLFVTLYHSQLQEFGLTFGRLNSDELYSLEALVSLFDDLKSRRFWARFVNTPEALSALARDFARAFEEFGKDVLANRESIFLKLEQLSKIRKEKLEIESKAEQVRPLAEQAFREGNFEQAAHLYNSIIDCLGEVEMKKLRVARMKM